MQQRLSNPNLLGCSADSIGIILGGSGVVISRVISPLIWVISKVTLLITRLITTHEPPSRAERVVRFGKLQLRGLRL